MTDAQHPISGRAGEGPRRHHVALEVLGRSERFVPVVTRSAPLQGGHRQRALERPRAPGGDARGEAR